MDKLYKKPWTDTVKRSMLERWPPFVPLKLPQGAEGADTLAGALVYRLALEHERAAWILWLPGPGVERYFGVRLGWSVHAGQLPYHRDADERRFTATSPIAGVPGGVLDLDQIEQKPVIGCIQIPSPWDRVASLKPATPRAIQREVTDAAAREAAALTDEERRDAVEQVVGGVMHRLEHRVPAFVEAVRAWQA